MNLDEALDYAQGHHYKIKEHNRHFLLGIALTTDYDFSILSIHFDKNLEQPIWVGNVVSGNIDSTFEVSKYFVSGATKEEFINSLPNDFKTVTYAVYSLSNYYSDLMSYTAGSILGNLFPDQLPDEFEVGFLDKAIDIVDDLNANRCSHCGCSCRKAAS